MGGGSSVRRALLRTGVVAVFVASPLVSGVRTVPAAAGESSGTVSATVVLQVPDTAAALSLSEAVVLPRSDRLARVRVGLPSVVLRESVERLSRTMGLAAAETTPWTVRVSGSRDAVSTLAATAGPAEGVSAVVVGNDDGHFHPRSVHPLSGAELRTAYHVADPHPGDAERPVVATLQLAGWDAADLTTFAARAGLPSPGPDTFTAVNVEGAPPAVDPQDSEEVALDQESVYAVDPYALQRAYFTSNDDQGVVDALYRVATDALSSPSLVALSTSWGACETDEGHHGMNVLHAALTTVVAAGVTVFASSGDEGAYDCGTPKPAVDYPASDPVVVAVGGTRLDVDGPHESAWGVRLGPAKEDEQGGGGGISSYWQRPAYQAGVAPHETHREVPDIAANADPAAGLRGWFDGASFLRGGTSLSSPVSAALFSAELASRAVLDGGVGDIHRALYASPSGEFRDVASGDNGAYQAVPGFDLSTGLGAPLWHSIVSRLLSAPAITTPGHVRLRRVPVTVATPGSQVFVGWATGVGAAPSGCGAAGGRAATPQPVTVPADGVYALYAIGYLGDHRCLTATTTVVVDTLAPRLRASLQQRKPGSAGLTYSWHASDDRSGVASVLVTVVRDGLTVSSRRHAAAGVLHIAGRPGSSYRLHVVAVDRSGNTKPTDVRLRLPYDDRDLVLGAGWRRVPVKGSFGGTAVVSATLAASAAIRATGSSYALLTRDCPTCGRVSVYVDGHHVITVDTYGPVGRERVVALESFRRRGPHQVLLLVTATHSVRSRADAVFVDGMAVQ